MGFLGPQEKRENQVQLAHYLASASFNLHEIISDAAVLPCSEGFSGRMDVLSRVLGV